MFEVAVCDDEPEVLNEVKVLLEKYRDERKITLKADFFTSPPKLLDAVSVHSYDLLIMDVIMPPANGIKVAREIRRYDSCVSILFLTSSPEFAAESYEVNAFYYIIKPVSGTALFPVLDRLVNKHVRNEETLTVKHGADVRRLSVSGIEYVEVDRKHILFHMDEGSTYEISGTLTELEPHLLDRDRFMKVHRSFIVNFSHVMAFEDGELLLYSGEHVPVARGLVPEVRQRFSDYLFKEDS